MTDGTTLDQSFVNATATIGEKIVLRRFALEERMTTKNLVLTNTMVVKLVLSLF